MERFWLVWAEGVNNSSPTRKHESLEDALQEARRVCVKLHSNNVYVLRAVGVYSTATPTWTPAD